MKRLKKLFIALTSLFSVVALFPLSACSGGKMHTLTMINENEDGGRLTGEGSYKTGSQVTISYVANKGYKFDKWDIDGETIKISNRSYSFKMPDKDITVKGNFIPKQYNVRIREHFNSEVTGAGDYDFNSEVTLTCTPNTGYHLVGWYEEGNNTLLSSDEVYKFKMPAKDLVINPKTERTEYNLTIVTSHPNNVRVWSTYSIHYYGDTYSLNYEVTDSTNFEHYGFYGIYEYSNGQKGDLISSNSSFEMPDHDYSIYVEFRKEYEFSLSGCNTTESWYYNYNFPGYKYSIVPYESKFLEFEAFYINDTLASTDKCFEFTMPEYDCVVSCKYKLDGVTTKLGEYPQTLITDTDLIAELDKIETTNSKGYIEYGGKQYFKDAPQSYRKGWQVPSKAIIEDDAPISYYYLVEPITWYKGKYFEDSDITVLFSQDTLFSTYPDSSEVGHRYLFSKSKLKDYLNTDFIDLCFNDTEKEMLQEVSIDSGKSSMIVDPLTYDKEYISGKVFLPGIFDFHDGNTWEEYTDFIPYLDDQRSHYIYYGSCSDYAYLHIGSYYEYSLVKSLGYDYLGAESYLGRDYEDHQPNFYRYSGYDTIGYINAKTKLNVRPIIYVKGL